MSFDQSEFDIRCEWGAQGASLMAPISDAVIIVDVMSFSTAVTIATARGATVFPYRWRDDFAAEYAKSVNAILAGPRGKSPYSLSPLSLMKLEAGSRLVLPSPNGSTITLLTGNTPTFAGCLRNCRAVARAAQACGPQIAVIPCGERWKDGSLRPAVEDLYGAGAIISFLTGSRSPEAEVAAASFERAESDISSLFLACSSGKELISMGFQEDITLISEIDRDRVAPTYHDGAFVKGL